MYKALRLLLQGSQPIEKYTMYIRINSDMPFTHNTFRRCVLCAYVVCNSITEVYVTLV